MGRDPLPVLVLDQFRINPDGVLTNKFGRPVVGWMIDVALRGWARRRKTDRRAMARAADAAEIADQNRRSQNRSDTVRPAMARHTRRAFEQISQKDF